MLYITIPATEQWNEYKQEFIASKEITLQLEHSLVSLSKWESKWCKPFFSKADKTYEETIDYIKCMTITQNVKDEVYYCLTQDNIDRIYNYINAPMTATTISNTNKKNGKSEQVTAEVIYYQMIAYQIPFECQKWHINRLLTLIRVCDAKNQPSKKKSQREIMEQYASLNEARRKQLNSKG